MPESTPRIVVLGGGSVGLYVARRLRQSLKKGEATVTVIDPRPYMQYAPFLPEAGAGNIDARDVVAPHRKALKHIKVLEGKVVRISHTDRQVEVQPEYGDNYLVDFDHVVLGLGSVSRTLPIPGLAENAIGFKNVEEAIAVRNRVLNRMDVAASVFDPVARKRLLTFTFIGGGFAGVEAIAEIEDMARYATRAYDTLKPSDLQFVMIEGSGRILPEVSAKSGEWALRKLQERGIHVHLNTFLNSCVDGRIVTSTGVEFETDTIVWTAGVKANPVLKEASDMPLDKLGRVTTNAKLQVVAGSVGASVARADAGAGAPGAGSAAGAGSGGAGAGADAGAEAGAAATAAKPLPSVSGAASVTYSDGQGEPLAGVWAAGDCAAVPDLMAPGKFCPPNAQYAIRQAIVLADNIVATLRNKPHKVKDFKHKNVGVVCSLGINKGVAEFMAGRIKLHGWWAWMAHRAYHVLAMPTGNRKARILIGWAGQWLLGREIVSLGSVEDPRHEFLEVAVPAAPPGTVIEQKAESAAATGTSGSEA